MPNKHADLTYSLLQAIQNKSAPEVEYFIKAGADVNNGCGISNLHVAAGITNNNAILRMLLEAGADPNLMHDDDVEFPLHSACWNSNIEGIRLLVEFGAHIDGVDKNKRTPLFYGLTSPEIIPVLAGLGADINHPQLNIDRSLLYIALRPEWIQAAIALARLGAKVEFDKLIPVEQEAYWFVMQQIKMEQDAENIQLSPAKKSIAL